ncbi:hypothetical protein [Marinimicrobium alkaliphilum]|uniref:hypothetical protein n=1 Tax=Marinimicrobium alkaliphilum TaxID=2202654 RepID=UPI000DB93119|nr:hypothetical protein [Marinimicrobium alkaliphilum]
MAVLAKKLVMVSLVAIISGALVVAMSYFLIGDVSKQLQALRSGDAVIAVRTAHGYLPGAIVAGGGVFLFSLSMFAFLYRKHLYRKLLPYCNWTSIAGVVLIFLGGMGFSYYWHQSALDAGYVKCGMRDSLYTPKIHTSYWVSDKAYCNNDGLARMLRYPTDDNINKVNRYLRGMQD